MSVQHEIGEQAHEFAVALQGWTHGTGHSRTRWGQRLEQNCQTVEHAVEAQRSDCLRARPSFEDIGSQCLVDCAGRWWQRLRGRLG